MRDKLNNADACMDGPFEVDIKVHVTDGERSGVVTVGLGNGVFPTRDDVLNAVRQAADVAAREKLRLMNRHEFITELLGVGRVAVPGPKEFKKP